MSQSLSQTFLAITRNSTDFEWLQGALAPLGQEANAGIGSFDELLTLVEVLLAGPGFTAIARALAS
jgi:pilus assembly protein CpaE